MSMKDIFKMGLAVNTVAKTFIFLNAILPKEKWYTERRYPLFTVAVVCK